MIILTFIYFPPGVNRNGPGQVQDPITYITSPWDNFMVHDVNNPLIMLQPTFKVSK
jgi:hypothetical protein